MTIARTMGTARTITSDAEACDYIIALIYERCRIKLHEGKQPLIRARLGKRMRHHGFATLGEYCDYLQNDADLDEFTLVVDALTTNYTSFLRESEHFEFLVEEALPALVDAKKKIHVWSAACSSGEEPYSIAFYLAERYPATGGWDWRITASDVSTKVLEKARQGIYGEDRLTAVPRDWLRKYFQRGTGGWAGHYRVKSSLAERISFQQVNLIEPCPHLQPFHVIFCRNVMIYFDRPTQERLVQQLCRSLVPHGFLLIGHSESLHSLDVPLRCLRPSIYQLKT